MTLVHLQRFLFAKAKNRFALGLGLRMVSFGVGLLALLPGTPSRLAPFAVAISVALAEIASWRSEVFRSAAERVLRMVELTDGLGIAPRQREVVDLLADLPVSIESISDDGAASYYASSEPQGVKRVLANMQESAWWTKHLAATMFRVTLTIVLTFTIASIAFLIYSLLIVDDQKVRESIARVVTATLMLVVSAGLIRFSITYNMLRERAKSAEDRASTAYAADTKEVEAVRILHDYQTGRASAPPIPDAVYLLRRKKLDELWKTQKV